MTKLSDDDRARVSPYVTDLDGPIFALKGLPEEVVAVLFAYYSRSRDDLRTNLARLLSDRELAVGADLGEQSLDFAENKAREFHEKWVVGYGHGSVAEHAVAHLALERVSIVASKAIEDARLAAYTEKSTRYVVFDQDSIVPLEGSLPAELATLYRDAATRLIDTYRKLYEPVVLELTKRITPREGQAPRAYDAAIRAQACDVLRYLLPAGVRTNIGMTINGRSLEHLLKKLNASPLAEVRQIATDMRSQASHVIPTLLKYVDPSAHRMEMTARVGKPLRKHGLLLGELGSDAAPGGRRATLVHHDQDALARVVTAIAYEEQHSPLADVTRRAHAAKTAELAEVFDAYVADRGRFDGPLRALEHTSYTFDVLLDHGAFRDMQRHRMQSQAMQRLGLEHGYELPDLAADLGVADAMKSAIDHAASAWTVLVKDYPEEAQYVVPLGAKRRYMFTCNLRELFHLIELRSARQGHISYRRVAQDLYHELERVHPWAAKHVRVDLEQYALARS